MKKLLSIFLIMLLMMGIFAGCTQTSSEPSQPKSSTVYPTKPIQIVVPAGAGGDTDINARMFAEYFSKEIGQPVVIVNTSGAGGSTGTRAVKDAESDGYKLLFFHSAALVSMLTGTMDFDIFKEFKILTLTSSDQTEALVVSGDSPYKTSADLISAAKANPGKLSCAIEIGSYGHLNTLIYEDLAGIDLKVVDGGSTAEKLPGLLGGKFDLMTVHLGAINDYIISGKMRSIGVLAEERLPKWSNIPTLKEQGIDLVFEKYCFLAANKNTPDDVCKIIQDAAIRALKNPEYIKKAKENYAVDINAISGEESTKKLKAQFDLFSKYKDLLNKK